MSPRAFFVALFTLCLTSPALAQSSAEIRAETQALIPERISSNLGERELLKRYLEEVRRRSEAESQNELGKIALQREIFSAYNQRWWLAYAEEQREANVNRYWQAYESGETYAQGIMSSTVGPNGCSYLKTVITLQGLPAPYPTSSNPADSSQTDLQDAFRRGVVAAYPACFINGLLDRLREFDAEVTGINRKLFEFEEKIRIYRPDEADLEALFQQIKGDFIAAMNKLADDELPRLKEAVELDATQLASVKRLAAIIAIKMDCANFSSRRGRTMSCAVNAVEAPYPVNRDAAFKVLFLGQLPGIYQQDIAIDPLFEAVNTYLTEVRPDDAAVRGLFEQLRTVLKRMDDLRKARLDNLKTSFGVARGEAMLALTLAHRNHWRDYFPKETQKQIIETFYSLKEKLEAYARLELATREEASLLSTIETNYGRALSLAQSIEMKLPIPARPIFVELNDQTHSQIVYPNAPTELPEGFLLGLTREEVAYWAARLVLQQ